MKRVGVLPFEEIHVPQRRSRLLASLGQDGAETAETARAYDRGVVPFRLPHSTCSLDAGPHTAGLQCGGAEVRRCRGAEGESNGEMGRHSVKATV